MTRRSFVCSAAAALAETRRRPPNIVLLLADDLGWADTSPYGADLHETPNLARLAAGGVRFTDAYAAAPVCSPTRASIMTGKYPARLHITIWHEASRTPPRNRRLIPPVTSGELPHSEFTLAEALRERGYLTAHVGKWHLGTATHYPESQGFDVNVGGTMWGAPQSFFYPYRGNRYYGGEFRYVPGLSWGGPGEYLTDRLTDEALRIIERARDLPFFLNLWFHNPHTPIEGKPKVVDRYRSRIRPDLHHRNPEYAAMIHSLDENIGRVLAKIDELGLADDTIVFFTSDNGGYIGRFDKQAVTDNHPLRSGKGSLYEGGIRVPLIVRWPGSAPAGKVCGEPVISNDLFSTILEMTSAGMVTEVDGASLVSLLRNPESHLARRELFFHYPHYYETTTPVSAVRAGTWKMLQYYEDPRVELYDLSTDIGERNDLSGKEPERAGLLRSRLAGWLKSVGAQMAQPNAAYGNRR